MIISPSYLKAVVIVHGKSELQICNFIKQNLRLKIEIESDKKGGKSIQIASLLRFLNGRDFKTIGAFKNKYKEYGLETTSKSKSLPEYFKIFTIMDTDDCETKDQKNNYINKKMFKNHWAYDYIIPIYNISKLEDIINEAKINYTKKEDYIKIFPTDDKYKTSDTIQINDLYLRLEKIKNTNLDVFLKFCLELCGVEV